jgi:hypothetical protein
VWGQALLQLQVLLIQIKVLVVAGGGLGKVEICKYKQQYYGAKYQKECTKNFS